MTWTTIPLADVPDGAGCEVGGKAGGVAALLAAGLAVPDGFVVCPPAPGGAPDWAANASADPAGYGPPAPARGAVFSGYAALAHRCGQPEPLVAVRSTSSVEDGEHHSAAGLLPTELGVRGAAAVAEAVARVSTGGSGLVREYAGDPEAVRGPQPVLVQLMVAPRAAGVSFSAHPVTGARDRILVEAVHGLGMLLTDGRVVPESATVERGAGRVVSHRPGRQRVIARLTGTGGVEFADVPEGVPGPALAATDLDAVWTATVAAERVVGVPVDVEWAIAEADGRLWLVQARPITTLPD